MIRNIVAAMALLVSGSIAEPVVPPMVRAQPDPSTAPVGVVDTIHVAPPRGEQMVDRASILAALAQTAPGDVIQFAPGTYVVGEIIPIETAHLTMLGHGDGTTLRGCHPDAYERMGTEVEAAGGDQWARNTALLTCGMFEMTGGHGTIRGLTFEYTAIGLVLGVGHSDSIDFHLRPGRVTDGGYLVEIRPRDPFPGNITTGSQEWGEANGSAIWISPGSDGNVVAGNAFEDIAAYEVFIEGDSNRVELASADDAVRDLGTGSRISGPSGSAAATPPLYESRFVEARGIRLQYMDFGGSGLPVIFVQDFHNYFSLEEESQHAAWLSRFADDFRVLAPVRRGYGESDDTGWGYDVATQSRDLLGLMDALGIRRAVLVGRNAATQDMTWIAEHYPERLAGLVYLENPLVFPDYRDPLARTFAEMYWRGTCDLGAGDDAIARTGPRAPWRPHFLYDDAARIDIPVLRFFAPQIESRSVDLRRLDRLASIAASDHCGDQVARDFFTALAADEERVAAIRRALTEGDLSLAAHHAMGRAFGTNLGTVTMEGDFAGREAIRDFRDPHIRSFLEAVAIQEGARQPGPARDPERRE